MQWQVAELREAITVEHKGVMMMRWLVVDEESNPPMVLARLDSESEAVMWISRRRDKAKIERGGYGIDGPVRYHPASSPPIDGGDSIADQDFKRMIEDFDP